MSFVGRRCLRGGLTKKKHSGSLKSANPIKNKYPHTFCLKMDYAQLTLRLLHIPLLWSEINTRGFYPPPSSEPFLLQNDNNTACVEGKQNLLPLNIVSGKPEDLEGVQFILYQGWLWTQRKNSRHGFIPLSHQSVLVTWPFLCPVQPEVDLVQLSRVNKRQCGWNKAVWGALTF